MPREASLEGRFPTQHATLNGVRNLLGHWSPEKTVAVTANGSITSSTELEKMILVLRLTLGGTRIIF